MTVRLHLVTKRYGGAVAVDRVSLTVRAGELLTVAGPRGAGKTTLLRLLSGREEPSSGTIHAGDAASTGGAATEWPVTFGSLDAAGAPAVAGAAHARGAAPERPDACVLLDEPLAAFQGPARAAAHEKLRALPAALGSAVVCTMDAADEADALAVSDRIAVLRAGRLRQCGTPSELMHAPADEFVATFFGRPRINLVPGILEKDGQAVLLGNQTVSLAGRIEETFCRDITLGIRPSHVRLTRDGAGLRGRVRSSEPFEDTALVRVDVEGVSIRAQEREGEDRQVGDAVRVRVDPRHYIVFDDRGVRLEQR